MPPERFHILLAGLDTTLTDTLKRSLDAAGFQIESVPAQTDAIDFLAWNPCDAVLLGMPLPDLSAVDVCRSLRSASHDLGIVIVRIGGTPECDIMALDAGADDCIAPPFRFREIVARLGAVLRRFSVEPAGKSLLRAGNLEMDIERRRFFRGGKEIHLSPREFDLLMTLMLNPETTLTHLKLLRAVWGSEAPHEATSLRTYIKALRKKIESDAAEPEYILTEPWVGYKFHNPHGSL